jgi:leucyl aminopeptidase
MDILIDFFTTFNIFIFTAGIERHRGRIVYLTYEPSSGSVDKTLYLVGKGVTYDTGGADIKAGGVMAGMSRDKCGAAAVAGFMQVHTYQPCVTYQSLEIDQ